jgi:vacuolar-type H+-ATPase subunit I/STV1
MAETTEDMLRKRLAAIRLLPPDKRAQAIKELETELKKLEQQRKKEIEEAVESAEEIGLRTVDELEEIRKSIPESRAVKMEELFAKKPEEAGRQELEKRIAEAGAEAARAGEAAGAGGVQGGPSYTRPFEQLRNDFYSLVDRSQQRLDELREKAAAGELNPDERASFENYFHAFEGFSQMSNYVSQGARERFLSEERTLGTIARYERHESAEAERRRRMAA